jgi:formiminoglutamase
MDAVPDPAASAGLPAGMSAVPEGIWSGRSDGSGPEHRRWHHAVNARPPTPQVGVALVGFASDEGVRRNHGRPGAADGPDALRRALAPLALHTDVPITDAGTVIVEDGDLEAAQDRLGDRIAALLDQHRLVVVLGGGHETAWGSYLGRTRSARLAGARTGVLNLDAHFDLREAPVPTSGTGFLQMARADRAAGRDFRYTVLGISEPSNTRALFRTAAEWGVEHLTDEECATRPLPEVLAAVDRLLAGADALHLGIDLDVLPAAVAPGVSAPAGYGTPLEVVHAVCRHAARSGTLAVVDVVELLPRLDVDGRTARTAARLITTIVHAAFGGHPPVGTVGG